jgi:hypothetical protein
MSKKPSFLINYFLVFPLLTLTVIFLANYLVQAWTEPTTAPPAGGTVTTGPWTTTGNDVYYLNGVDGNVGVGTDLVSGAGVLNVGNGNAGSNNFSVTSEGDLNVSGGADGRWVLQRSGTTLMALESLNEISFASNVGIYRTDPVASLDVRSNTYQPVLRVESSGGVGAGFTSPLIRLRPDDLAALDTYWDIYGSDGAGTPNARFGISQTTGGSTENFRLIIDQNGNVGIGDVTPDNGAQQLKLDVEGAVGASNYCDASGNNCKAITAIGAGTACNWVGSKYFSQSNVYTGESRDCGGGVFVPGYRLITVTGTCNANILVSISQTEGPLDGICP